MKFPCVLIDHDDTAVDSTPIIHHPSHIEQMKQLGLEAHTKSLEDWFRVNYDPGFRPFMLDVLKLNEDQLQLCYKIWRQITETSDPPFFPGMLPLLEEISNRGGTVIVVSHSEAEIIERHYRNQKEVPGFMPRDIFGWTGKPDENKPSVWPVTKVMERYGFAANEIVMIDDLKPGIEMARQAGITSIGAGWSHRIPEIREDLQKSADIYFDDIKKAADWLLSD